MLPKELQDVQGLIKRKKIYFLNKKVAGELIRKMRLSAKPKLSVRQMAKILGMSHTHYSDLERGIKTWSIENFTSAYECIIAYTKTADGEVATDF